MLLLLACADPPPPDVLLVSLDTTRADVIDAETTPNLWALAERGVRFTAAFAHAPTTLSSHASVWTGQDPHGHAVPRNGYALPATLPVLPEKMAAAGYDTLAVIGASALARPMGMDRGFRLWDETLDRTHEKRHEARADSVTDRALALLGQRRRGSPVFLFAHYYDAHAPYAAPPPFTERWCDPNYTGTFDGSRAAMQDLGARARVDPLPPADLAELRARYRGEVAYVDQELGRLLAGMHDPWVVVFGDHGEALGDVADRPLGHGPDIDPPAVHVPLIVAGPGVSHAVVATPVALSDIGATVLALVSASPGLGSGQDLTRLWRDEPFDAGDIFLEATQPRQVERGGGWNNLGMERGVIRGGWLLSAAPFLHQEPTLSRWREDVVPPDPLADLVVPEGGEEGIRVELAGVLSAWDTNAPPFRPDSSSEATKEGLRALGYLE